MTDDLKKLALAREIVEDINALLQGDIEGEAQVRGILVEARDALAAMGEREAVKAERDAWEAELRPLIAAGAFEGADFEKCENCGAPLSVDEVARVDEGPTGCWRYLTGRDNDPCPGDGRKRVTTAIRAGEGEKG